MARSYVFRLESKRPLHEIIRAVESLGLVRSFREDTGSELQPVPKKVASPKPLEPSAASKAKSLAGNARAALWRDKVAAVLEPLYTADIDTADWRAVEALNKSDVKPWKGGHWSGENVQPHIRALLDRLTKPS